MKELSIEEKAKAYDEALKRAKDFENGEVHYAINKGENIMHWIFPELKESEDEKIRVKFMERFPYERLENDGVSIKEALAWLKKQGENKSNPCDGCVNHKGCIDCENGELRETEQKPAWNKEDINKPNGGIVMEDFNDGNGFYKVNLAYLNEEQVKEIEELVKRWDGQLKENEDESIISDLLDYFDEDKCLKHEVNDIVKWLKTIKPQQKGWSDNEIKMFDNLITYLDGRKGLLEEIKRTYIDWLKSIKSRVKPKQEWSEEDQNALEDVREAIVHYWGGDTQDILLYWLKSLKQKIGGEQ